MIRVALAQIDTWVGDIDRNVERIRSAVAEGRAQGAQIVALPELAVTGYPPEDLVLKRSFVRANEEALGEVARMAPEMVVVVGFVDESEGRLHNAAAICHGSQVAAIYHKQLLPNYGVFDEQRYFRPGNRHVLIDAASAVVGVCVCEDAWDENGPVVSQGDAGAQIVVNINASPYHKGKLGERRDMLAARARRAKASIVYVNSVGGQDELVFDGGSLVLGPGGEVVAELPQFAEMVATVDVPVGPRRTAASGAADRIEVTLPPPGESAPLELPPRLGDAEEIYRALVVGLRDYATKNDFDKAVIGLSGGIDSSLTAAIAADALGSGHVLGVAMPSEFSSQHSLQDAKALATNLEIDYLEVPITRMFHAFLETLEQTFGHADKGLAEENLQARIRGNILMAISNRYGHLVLATGNKSELACGYATLYGDMAGGFALLKDVFKTEVYELSRWRNSSSPAIPEGVLTKPPSAELRPDQKDSDSLPPYEVLDPILEAYIEDDASIGEIVAAGAERATVEWVVRLVDRAEYKRRQAPPGPKVTTKAFGRDRRLPISNRWRHGSAGDLPDEVTGESRPHEPR